MASIVYKESMVDLRNVHVSTGLDNDIVYKLFKGAIENFIKEHLHDFLRDYINNGMKEITERENNFKREIWRKELLTHE